MNSISRRVLVAGGAGFLGSHLCERLLAQGREVIALDNFITGAASNMAHLLDHPRFTFVSHDVCIPLHLEVDEIYNLACPASPAHYQRDPVLTLKASVLGSLNLLELATRTNASILQASTSEVYGDPAIHPQTEAYWGNVNPIGPRACYDEGKRCAETLFFDYRRQYGTRVKVARIFNTYGPRMQRNDGRVVSNFIVQALRDQDMTIYGNGLQSRSFCYVDDLIDALILTMQSPDAVIGPLNVGNPNEIAIADLAKRIIELIGSRSKLTYIGLPIDDPVRRCPDISRAREVLRWQPSVSLDDGLARTIDYFEQMLRHRKNVDALTVTTLG